MSKYLDDRESILISCPECGETFSKSIGDMKTDPEFPCPSAASRGSKSDELLASLGEAEIDRIVAEVGG